ncbi:hypothetical protein [Pedobacter ghigonis]|uniref:hypothetical protein n=1 Tax=Pedobacter ghigonis TaxID=2730403 RepID=UPI00158D4FE6|nr:hypothetical protein [Pedobacter ghigonis]
MSTFSIGSIVSLRTHPFREASTGIIISGEHLMTPPTMVVSEVISKQEDDGEDAQNRYKCLWFSTKKNEFSEHWFSASELSAHPQSDQREIDPIFKGSLVSLKNLQIEMGKRRSFLQIESKVTGGRSQTNSIAAHMVFIPPVMLVLQVSEHDPSKLPKGVSKKNKIFPTRIAKCKYYNAASEKYSEVVLPIEALLALPIISETLIGNLEQAIKQSSYLLIGDVVVKPINLYCKSGLYFITAFNFITLQNEEIALDKLGEFTLIATPFIKTAPGYLVEESGGQRLLKQSLTVEQLIKDEIASNGQHYLQIKYSDKFGNQTYRTIDNYEILLGPDVEEVLPKINYVRAYCNLRKAVRHFRMTGILESSLLVIQAPNRRV